MTGLVLDHIINRRVARLEGFHYLRIVPISRAANSSSGGLSERWAVEYHSTPEMVRRNNESPAFIQYADPADIVKMLSIKTGGFVAVSSKRSTGPGKGGMMSIGVLNIGSSCSRMGKRGCKLV